MKKIIIRISLNTLLGLVLIFFWLKIVNINDVIDRLSKVNYLLLLPFFVFFGLSSALRALRLKILLSDYKIPYKNLLFLNYLSQLLSFTIPLRLGELTKGVYLSTQYAISLPKAIVWIFMDRFVDFLLVVCLALIFLSLLPTGLGSDFKFSLIVIAGLITLAVIILVVMPNISRKIADFISKLLILKPLKKLFLRFSNFMIDAASVLRLSPVQSLTILSVSVLALLLEGLCWWLVFWVASGEQLNYFTLFLGSLLSSLTYLIPAAPGYVGSAQVSTLAVFSLGLGIDKDLTSVVAVLTHLLTLISILVFGLVSLYLLKFDLNLVWKKFKKD